MRKAAIIRDERWLIVFLDGPQRGRQASRSNMAKISNKKNSEI
jgi:hypothetical protein